MQANETVYEFGSSPDEDDDNNGQSSTSPNSATSKKNKNTHSFSSNATSSSQQLQQSNQPTSIAGTNLRPNKTSSTSINQKLNTSFSSISDSHHQQQQSSHSSPNPKLNIKPQSAQLHHLSGAHDMSASDDQLLLTSNKNSSKGGGGPSSLTVAGAGSISNTSHTSLSSTTNSSRGNVSQSGNQSMSASSQKSLGHQPSSSSQQQQNPNFDSNVISERVKNLATQIYQELKRIISRCNYDEDILSGLMPLIVRVLESLDLALIENQQLQVELELCKDDNEQLVVMFEKEKATKRAIDKKLFESEYAYEEERQQYQQKIESLDNIVKMFELKAKNASDQATRFEEKEAERKREYKKLHDRYTELLKSHCDVVERVRHLVGSAEAANLSSINVPQQMVASSSDLTSTDSQAQHLVKAKLSKHDDVDFGSRTLTRDGLKSWNADTELTLEDASLVVIDDMLESHGTSGGKIGDVSSHNESDRATTSEPDAEHEKESENDSIAYTSMEKEFRKLIQENKDLLNTKNALNVVKDDLIAEVDRLTNEVSMYEQAVEQLNSTKDQMKHKVSALDTELRKTKEDLEKAKQKIRENNEEGVPYSQRKRFGRAEMAKVLMERNNYKERFMELQDAVRYTELVRANKVETEKRSGLWKFFSNLFGAPPTQAITAGGGGGSQTLLATSRNLSPVISYHGSPAASAAAVALASVNDIQQGPSSSQLVGSEALKSATRSGSILSTNQRLSSNSDLIVLMDSDLNIDRNRAFRDATGRLSAASDSSTGYIHAYGWSLPASSVKALTGSSGSPDLVGKMSSILGVGGSSGSAGNSTFTTSSDQLVPGHTEGGVSFNKLSGLQVPIPQYCRPLTGDSLGMKIWCATAIDLSGGDLPTAQPAANQSNVSALSEYPDTSGSVVNISSSTPIKSSTGQRALKQLEQEVDQALRKDNTTGETIGETGNSSRTTRPILKTTSEMVFNAIPFADDTEELSTCVWICSTQHSRSKITIVDIKTKPNELLDAFYVPTFLYCIKSIPGTKTSDLLGITISDVATNRITLNLIEELIGNQRREFYKLVQVDMNAESRLRKRCSSQDARIEKKSGEDSEQLEKSLEQETSEIKSSTSTSQMNEEDSEISRILDNNVSVGIATLQKLNDFVAHTQPSSSQQFDDDSKTAIAEGAVEVGPDSKEDGHECKDVVYYQPISTHLSTVWMGGKDSILYVHSAIGQWKDCLACVKLRDSILQICHHKGRVFVALADGSLCVFFRNVDTKQWEFSQYLLIDIGLMSEATCDLVDMAESSISVDFQSKLYIRPQTSNDDHSRETSIEAGSEANNATLPEHSFMTPTSIPNKNRTKVAGIRCLEIANRNLWIGYRNRVLIIDPITLKLKHTFNVVPQVDNQIRQLISMKDGVFCCLRSDLILRLYSSLRPYQHIQNIDIEPVVTRLISPKTFVISHITAMRVADNTLWIGNAHGIILTIPCKLVPQISEAPMINRSGEYEESSGNLSIARFVPKCDITNAQISFHGHRDAVKFFISAHNLMLSGGQGYLDFRLDMDDQSKSISDKSHLILWQLPN